MLVIIQKRTPQIIKDAFAKNPNLESIAINFDNAADCAQCVDRLPMRERAGRATYRRFVGFGGFWGVISGRNASQCKRTWPTRPGATGGVCRVWRVCRPSKREPVFRPWRRLKASKNAYQFNFEILEFNYLQRLQTGLMVAL